jgi:hypothetical protein
MRFRHGRLHNSAGTKSCYVGLPGWFQNGASLNMRLKGMVASAALLALGADASAGETSGLLRKASCSVVRYYVGKYSAVAAETWARSHGATDAEIEAARHCLKDTPQPIQAVHLGGQ